MKINASFFKIYIFLYGIYRSNKAKGKKRKKKRMKFHEEKGINLLSIPSEYFGQYFDAVRHQSVK